jgi:hypothetical protein
MAELGAGPRLTFELTTERDITTVRSVDELVQPVIRTPTDRLVIDRSDALGGSWAIPAPR